MRNWITICETVDPRWREVSSYILSVEPIERDETVADILQTAHLEGFGGHCFAVALAINTMLFGGKGEIVAAYNTPMMQRHNRFLGHVAVLFDGQYWDADGRPKPVADIESWGMLDPEDDDIELTPEEAEMVTVKPFSDQEVLDMARARGDDPKTFEDAIARAVGQSFDFD